MARSFDELIVYLNGGLNTSDDPSSIDPDQLQEATGMEYRPPRQGLFAIGGRSRFDQAGEFGANDVHGLVFADFEGGTANLVAFAGASALSSSGISTSPTGAFQTRKAGLTDTLYADAVHYGDLWFFFNGTDKNWVLKNDLTTITHGFVAITATGTITTATGGNLKGTYQIWSTEYDSVNDVESAFNGVAASYTFGSPNQRYSFARPTQQNTQADQWRVYMGIANQIYPNGFIVATASAFSITSVGVSAEATVTPYEIVAPPGGIAVSARSEPPKCIVMRVFQDSLVAIDKDDRQAVKFSLADDPHYFPSVNRVPINPGYQDDSNALEVCNNAILVFTGMYGYRLDDLPRDTDAEDIFTSAGRSKEPFSNGHGCVSPRGTAVFSVFGSGELCLFVSRDGIWITDGYKADYASRELDWENTVDISSLSRSVLKNNPKRSRVEFYYASKANSSVIERLDFYYHPGIIRPPEEAAFPRLPILGPTRVPGYAATLGILNSDYQMFAGSTVLSTALGGVYVEGTGTSDAAQLYDSAGTINKRWKVKDFYPAGINGAARVQRVYTHQSQVTASGTGTLTATFRDDAAANDFTATSQFDQSKKNAQPHFSLDTHCQAFNLRGVKDDGGAWQEVNYLVFVVKGAAEVMTPKT